mgnify:CR=1 FL=1
MFGVIRKSSVKSHIDSAVKNVSVKLGEMHDAEKRKIHSQYEDKIKFLLAEKESEIDEYCRQNAALRSLIERMERDAENVKQGAIENTRLANCIDKVAKNILDTTDKVRVDMVQSISEEFKKYIETLAIYWQATAEIVNDTRAQQRRVIK